MTTLDPSPQPKPPAQPNSVPHGELATQPKPVGHHASWARFDLPQGFVARSFAVVAYALAMGYLESAVVVYLRAALGIDPGSLGPLPQSDMAVDFGAIEVGREAATLVMLAAVGWIAGRRPLERLAWVAVAFGIWDISYYVWLWVFVGWPPSIDTWDLLFLIPVSWTAPVWAPCAVSAALIAFGLAAARASELGRRLHVSLGEGAAASGGGFLVYLSFTLGSDRVVADPTARDYPWPIFVAGMALAMASGATVLRRARRTAPTRPAAVAAVTE